MAEWSDHPNSKHPLYSTRSAFDRDVIIKVIITYEPINWDRFPTLAIASLRLDDSVHWNMQCVSFYSQWSQYREIIITIGITICYIIETNNHQTTKFYRRVFLNYISSYHSVSGLYTKKSYNQIVFSDYLVLFFKLFIRFYLFIPLGINFLFYFEFREIGIWWKFLLESFSEFSQSIFSYFWVFICKLFFILFQGQHL